jgi:hypothetical protein
VCGFVGLYKRFGAKKQSCEQICLTSPNHTASFIASLFINAKATGRTQPLFHFSAIPPLFLYLKRHKNAC